MTASHIRAEAVEAAAREFFADWDGLSDQVKRYYRQPFTDVLAAADPFMHPDCGCGRPAASPRRRLAFRRLSLYLEPRDAWIGVFVSPAAVYVCPLPFLVIRWQRVSAPP